ncbi:integrase_H2C2 domain-containing protein [Trichonephila clavipes]|nr:integrase_H2C2 domain-containing protein [Trichonephila clavipes]
MCGERLTTDLFVSTADVLDMLRYCRERKAVFDNSRNRRRNFDDVGTEEEIRRPNSSRRFRIMSKFRIMSRNGRENGNTRQIFSSHDEYEPCDGTEKDQDLAKLKLLSNSSKNEEFRFIDGILCRKNFDPDGKLWLPVIPKHLRADILRHFHDAPTAGHLGLRKLMTGFARDFTGRECTEMSFGMLCIVGSAKGESPFLNDHLDV